MIIHYVQGMGYIEDKHKSQNLSSCSILYPFDIKLNIY